MGSIFFWLSKGGRALYFHCSVYKDILRTDGQVNESNNQIHQNLALEKLTKKPPSESFFILTIQRKMCLKEALSKQLFEKRQIYSTA